MFNWVLDAMFGCRHNRTSFPLTPKGPARRTTYVTCLDCGRELDYDWREMRIARPVRAKHRHRAAGRRRLAGFLGFNNRLAQ